MLSPFFLWREKGAFLGSLWLRQHASTFDATESTSAVLPGLERAVRRSLT